MSNTPNDPQDDAVRAAQRDAEHAVPPMRYSADPHDLTGYANFRYACAKHRCLPIVLLDGKPVDHVVTADEQLGLVLQLVRPLQEDGDRFATVELYGRVEVRWSQQPAAWHGSMQDGA